MIFMALLPKSEDRPVSHGSSLPPLADVWTTVTVAIAPRVPDTIVGEGRYRIAGLDDKAITLVRTESNKPVRITRSKVEKTYARLWAGEVIPFRGIDYTVAIEFGVVLALGDLVEVDEAAKVYRLSRVTMTGRRRS